MNNHYLVLVILKEFEENKQTTLVTDGGYVKPLIKLLNKRGYKFYIEEKEYCTIFKQNKGE